jgi:hypothetical protein
MRVRNVEPIQCKEKNTGEKGDGSWSCKTFGSDAIFAASAA